MKHIILAGALVGLSGFAAVAATASVAPWQAASETQSKTIEGCLMAGSASGEFLVSTGSERHTVVAGQGIDLAAHVNHRVQLQGALEKGTSGQVFRATAVKMLAASCSAS